MCGIIGYIGRKRAQPILLNSLKRLEYRGYDSCGIAVASSSLKVYKDTGRVAELEKTLPVSSSQIGIGHTRWATHGKPSKINAHPHLDCTGRIAVVHNGVIDNFQQLREKLTQEGHLFRSETDTEVLSHLVEKYYRGDLAEAVSKALLEVQGSYAIIAVHEACRQLVAARNGSPLIIGLGDRENFLASDVPAVLDYTDRVIYMEDGDIALATEDGVRLTNNGVEVERMEHGVPWSIEDAQKSGYEHFMLKEIHEQPKVIANTIRGYVSEIEPGLNLGIKFGDSFQDILMVACGTSYHAALIGKFVIGKLARIPVRVEIASEFDQSHNVLGKTLVIGLTQSGETADTLMALKKARSSGLSTLCITNVLASSATRIAEQVLYTRAGPEIGVAASKSFIAQLIALYLLALSSSELEVKFRSTLIQELRELPNKVQLILDEQDKIAFYGKYLAKYENVFFIARGINLPVALEGALKLKEISYIHAEGYPAGELKHGPFALLLPTTPVIALATKDSTYQALLTNIKEVKARGAPVIAVADEDDDEIEKYVDFALRLPSANPIFSPVLNAVALQLLAYYTAKERGCPIDMPRNLAKSVTVA